MESRTTVRFLTPDKDEFFITLRKRVNEYFKSRGLSKKANGEMVAKSIILLMAYILPLAYVFIVNPPFWVALIGWAIAGIALAGIGMSVMHDANHGAYSDNKTVNFIMGHTLNLLGGSVFNWKLQHNVLHHTYTNIPGLDDDIQDRAALRLSPYSEVKGYHRLQWLYATFFYGLMTLYWVLAKDLIQYDKYLKDGTVKKQDRKRGTMLLILSNKIIYLFVILGVPVLFFNLPFYQVLIGFLLMQFMAGVILAYVFQLAHTVEGTTHPLPDEHGIIENSWARHQMNTTVDFSPGNRLISWYVGGLNYQIEHHLFPNICHVHYPEIAGIVKETAKEFNVPYMVNHSFWSALRSHFIILKRRGKLPDLGEIMA